MILDKVIAPKTRIQKIGIYESEKLNLFTKTLLMTKINIFINIF